MAIFKCKMCGGALEIKDGESVAVCEYCGTQQTLPKLDDERRANMYDRANHFRRNNDFDKAMLIYEQILNEDNTDAEAYWSLVLCRYGIEYVEDPATHKRIPTVNRAQFTSIYMDEDYKSALQYADGYQKTIYEEEAKAIDEIQKGILAISQKEEPFDVFICYKETDNNGRRTPDSVLANDLYHQLTQEGFKVFFARITLEDKLGSAYEPYIFAALNSAKVMVVLGTKPEFFNAVWVKNEWSRYLALIKNGAKKMLIPAYKDMDPYDLPEEFSHLQALDMSKLGFMQDLIRGIGKILNTFEPHQQTQTQTVVVSENANVAPLLERVFLFLEDGKWQDANIYCEKVLDIDPKNAEAYVGKLMAELNIGKRQQLADCKEPFNDSENFAKIIRFGDEKTESEIRGYIAHINERNENERLQNLYDNAIIYMHNAASEDAYKSVSSMFQNISGFKNADALAEQCRKKAEIAKNDFLSDCYRNAVLRMKEVDTEYGFRYVAAMFKDISGFKDSDTLAEQCLEKAEICYKVDLYETACQYMAEDNIEDIQTAIRYFSSISGWKDSDKNIVECNRKIEEIMEEIKEKQEADRLENERKEEECRIATERKKKKLKKVFAIITLIICTCLVFLVVLISVIIPNGKYNAATELYNAEEYLKAAKAFSSINFKDSETKAAECFFIMQKDGLKNASVGKSIKFGFYEQDNNKTNGKEEIEWIVLAVEGKKALIISKYALDCKTYNSSYAKVTWETCSLRPWLNDLFFDNAFGDKHKELILFTNVTAEGIYDYESVTQGNSTTDRVFLLSSKDFQEYLYDDEKKCVPTEYAISQGVYTYTGRFDMKDGKNTCEWWLRTTESYRNCAYCVSSSGYLDTELVNSSLVSIRPAMWIDIGD